MNNQKALSHFGIPGMHWGQRKAPNTKLQVKTKGITLRSDGSMEIEKGCSMQRLVRKNGDSLPLKDITYASITDHDNAKYVKYIGGKGFFGGGRDTVVQLTAQQKIKAPSVDEASKITSDLFINNAKFRKNCTDSMGRTIPDKELAAIKKDPSGKEAKMWYTTVNNALNVTNSGRKDLGATKK